jgi:hypothetical protein
VKENKKFWEELIAYTDRTGNDVSNNSYIAAYVFVVAVMLLLPSRCLATIWGYTETSSWMGFMKDVIEVGSGSMICIHTCQGGYIRQTA